MGTNARNNITLVNKLGGAKHGTKVGTPGTNLGADLGADDKTKVGWSQKQDKLQNIEDIILETPQMNMRQGIKMFGEEGVQSVKKEMQQLHDRKVMAVRDPKELTPEQKKEALAYLMFLKRKRCGKIKGRGCADGQK